MAGGPIQSVSIRGRIFPVAGDADVSRVLGGFTSEVEMNGDGSGRIVQTAVPWKLENVTLSLDDTNGGAEFLQEVANSQSFSTISITLRSGLTYSGQGTVTGDFSSSTMNSTCQVTLSGPGTLTLQ